MRLRRRRHPARENNSSTSSSEKEDEIRKTPSPVTSVIYSDLTALLNGGSDLSFLFKPAAPSCGSDELIEKDNGDGSSSVVWFGCVVWNSNVLKELELHAEWGHRLYSTLALGRLLSTCVQEERQSWPGIRLMDWRTRPFVLMDIIDANFGTCGSHPYLRVQETPTGNTVPTKGTTKPKLWDLVIFEECTSLANEMARRVDSGVNTSVVIWGALQDVYPEPWIDGKDHVLGEIHLNPRRKKEEDPLTILIFHHETISDGRTKRVQECSRRSELWKSFQDSELEYKWFSNSCLDEGHNHFSFHVVKNYKQDKNSLEARVEEGNDKDETLSTGKDHPEVDEAVVSEQQATTWGGVDQTDPIGKDRRRTRSSSSNSPTCSKKLKGDKNTAEEAAGNEEEEESSENYRFTALLDEI